ncbi:hypothetical protein PsYK624_062110 [Phanerochaete sordida]|uniref:Uncharacterized protein n=1 Tax=Phanerochaete sordida TaxID=48140 RepID=A0A9P3LD90_9APHY|nr:hypothetical protein PsYK624_062110 [Phanerochaete sordida]
MASEAPKFVLPPDFTFTPGGVVAHKDTYELLANLMKEAPNRDPDAHDMYIYNDFYGYAMLELYDELLHSAHTFVTKKEWMKAFAVVDAMNHYNGMIGKEWTHVDDGERVEATEQAFGVVLVATLRGLEASSMLNEATIPILERTLEHLAAWPLEESSAYVRVLKGYGKKLFGTRTAEERKQISAARSAAYDEFVRKLSPEEREQRGDDLSGAREEDEEEDEDEDEDEDMEEDGVAKADRPWFGKAKAKDADLKDNELRLPSVWKEYMAIWRRSPHLPLRGPPEWDLTKWSAAEKRPFAFATMDDED